MAVRRIALTGGIASGKSLVETYLIARGVPVIDADHVVHQMLKEDTNLQDRIRADFGEGLFNPDGTVDRDRLGRKVFNDKAGRKRLEDLIHPGVRDAMIRFFTENALAKLAVASIPLFFESNLEPYYDEVWLLDVDKPLQMQRLLSRPNMTPEHAQARIDSQMAPDEKHRRAQAMASHEIIDNRGTLDNLYRQLDGILKKHGL